MMSFGKFLDHGYCAWEKSNSNSTGSAGANNAPHAPGFRSHGVNTVYTGTAVGPARLRRISLRPAR